MKCPNCQRENPEDAIFCNGCGHKLELACPECGKINPLDSKFCNKCGHNLTLPLELTLKDLSFDEKLEKIQRYLPKGLTEKILSQKDRIEGERKQVTVLFCDMAGFTVLSEKLGPEEAYAIMDEVYEILIHKVHDYEGTVNEMTGDGIMALFGAPIALEDAPQRAIRSAYAIHREMTKFSDKIKQEKEGLPPLKMRIGIHTGPVVVGTLGNDLRVEFKAVGDTVNLASRMEGLAEPGTTYVTDDTFRLSEGYFRFEALGEKKIKGKEEPVGVFRVIAPSTRRTRFDVSAERGLTPFIGRERELELLLEGFERAKDGRGQAFSIVSEAGVGKSRLLYEFRKAVANEDVTFLEGKCLSYSRGVAYHPVIDILKSNFDVRADDEDSEIGEKIKRGLKLLGADEASTLPYLLELLSVKDSGIDKIPMSPEAKKDRIIEALKRIVLKGSEIRHLIMAIEDLHWIDNSSEDLLKDLLDSISGARVFLIFTYRPEFVHTWGGRSYHSQVTLNRLSNHESLAMVTYLLGPEEIERELEELILEKTEGIPFFIEEFVKSLKDLNLIERKDEKYCLTKDFQDVTIPSTIQDIIMTRVDSLPEATKEMIQTSSVIEREFKYELIKQVTGLPEQELLSNLSVLKDAELLYERGIYPETAYIFKHALTREVVYDSLLTKRKKKLHGKIGDAIEDLYRENIGEHYGILVEHFIESGNYKKGAEYSKMAGRKTEKAAAIYDAIAYAKKWVTCLERLHQTEEVRKKIIDARTVQGLYLAQMNYFVEAKEAVEPISELALKSGYKRRQAQIYTIIGAYNYFVEEDFPKVFKYLEDALVISKEVNDIISLVLASYWLGSAQAFCCNFEEAYQNLKRALDINTAANSLWGMSIMKGNLSGEYYCLQGKIDLAYQISEEAIGLAEESGDIYSKTITYIRHGITSTCKGFVKEAKESLLKGLNFGERINFFSWNAISHFCLAGIYFESGEYQKAVHHYDKAGLLFESSRFFPSFKNICKIGSAKSKVLNHETDIDLEPLCGYVQKNKLKCYEGTVRRFMGEIFLNIDDQHTSEAKDWIEKAIGADKRNGTMFNLAGDYELYAKWFKRKGNLSSAKENLSKAIEILKECGADGWVEKYEKELTEL
jgi:class 3 adenylate cyclase/tetratricopeptide (TPR) repeat protein